MTVDAAAASGPGSSVPRAGGAGLPTQRPQARACVVPSGPRSRWRRSSIYTFLGLGIPTLAVIELAFRTESGKLTLANMHTDRCTGPTASASRTASCWRRSPRSFPGSSASILAYAIETSHAAASCDGSSRPRPACSRTSAASISPSCSSRRSARPGSSPRWLNVVRLNPWNHGFNLYSFYGVALVYMYFQIPLMVLVITPALGGLRPSWREAAENLGCLELSTTGAPSAFRCCCPRCSAACCCCSAAAFAAYATADTLTAGTVTLAPIQIGAVLNGNVIAGEENIGYAIGFGMLVVLTITMILYGARPQKGLEMASLIPEIAAEEVLGVPEASSRTRSAGGCRGSASGGASSCSSPGRTSSSRSMPGCGSPSRTTPAISRSTRSRPSLARPGSPPPSGCRCGSPLVTTVLTMVLMVPTAIYVHLKLPKMRRVLDFVTILPIVIPPIVLILGVLHAAPLWLRSSPVPVEPRLRHPRSTRSSTARSTPGSPPST